VLSNKIIPIKKKSKINEYDARKNVEIKEQSSGGFKIPKNAALWKKAYSLALYSVSFRGFFGKIKCFPFQGFLAEGLIVFTENFRQIFVVVVRVSKLRWQNFDF
tara:strand:- start:212 stop:523 length:312 start_codon:yes stop_codon:yes gene_type:complete